MMRSIVALVVLLACASTCVAGDWKLVWADEFDRDGLPDAKSWGYEEGFVRNHESQFYTRGRAENARIEKGVLIIEGRKETLAGAKTRKPVEYTSASLISRHKEFWTYGRMEVRAKVPPGKGMWPAIWMMGENEPTVGWPRCGEVDIMEYVGKFPDAIYGTVHFGKGREHASSGSHLNDLDPAADFHVYATEWSPEQIKFFYDDRVYHAFAVKDADGPDGNPFHRPMYLILNLALGGDWGGPIDDSKLPAKFLIDYVRVYQKNATTQPATKPAR